MPGIEIKGRSKRANYRHGGRTGKFGGGRTNLLEQLGRVEGERSNPNRRAEISRVHGELNRGYAKGGRIGLRHGKYVRTPVPHADISKYMFNKKEESPRTRDELSTMKIKPKKKKLAGPKAGRPAAAEGGRIGLKDGSKRFVKGTKREKQISMATDRPTEGTKLILRKGTKPYTPEGEKVGKRIELKKGGSDKKWMQKVSASIKKRGTKGKCTPITKPGCTGRAKALAKTFKKIAARRKA